MFCTLVVLPPGPDGKVIVEKRETPSKYMLTKNGLRHPLYVPFEACMSATPVYVTYVVPEDARFVSVVIVVYFIYKVVIDLRFLFCNYLYVLCADHFRTKPFARKNTKCFAGIEEQMNQRNNKESGRIRTTSTSIAEEAVDQLQASEKLIAGWLQAKRNIWALHVSQFFRIKRNLGGKTEEDRGNPTPEGGGFRGNGGGR